MTSQYYSLKEVAKLLEKQPYQITYLILTGKVPEPKSRFAGKRLFSESDIERLRSHFELKKQERNKHEIQETNNDRP